MLFWLPLLPAEAQKTVEGRVTNAESGEPLPAASVHIEDTYRGSITNEEGKYSLSIPDSLWPVTLIVRHIGYENEQRRIEKDDRRVQDFGLYPATAQLEEIVITAENPGNRIMQRVIEHKQDWRKNLRNYQSEAYTRQTLFRDTSIVMITESASGSYWHEQKGHREVVEWKQQSRNIAPSENLAGVRYLPNFYDDNIQIAGFDVIGVTHPEALKYYDFEVVGRTSVNNQLVYEIEVHPARKLQPLFEGSLKVLAEKNAMLEVRLRPNKVVDFPPPVRAFSAYYEQQFNNYGESFWLPSDVRIVGDVDIAMPGLKFPQIGFRQISQFTNYRVNTSLPDSIFDQQTYTSRENAQQDSLGRADVQTVPLSEEENKAYNQLDSTQTLEKAFEPSGFLARFIDETENGSEEVSGLEKISEHIPGSFAPKLRFNRVDELHAGLRYKFPDLNDLRFSMGGGYSTGNKRWEYQGNVKYTLQYGSKWENEWNVGYFHGTQSRYQSKIYNPAWTFIPNLLGNTNYFDYFNIRGSSFNSELRHSLTDVSIGIELLNQRHRSLPANSMYDVLRRQSSLQINPPIEEGNLVSLKAFLGYNLNDQQALGITGNKSIRLAAEYSDGMLGSDFNFINYYLEASWRFETFLKRRLLPNTLDVTFQGGTFTGDAPPQKYGIVDAALAHISPFGSLKTIQNRPYEGKTYGSLIAEHNFRTIPFEVLGLDFLSEKNYGIILFGGAAYTSIPEERNNMWRESGYLPRMTSTPHLEAGISLNGVLGLFRIDFAQRLDRSAFTINISTARMF